MLNDLLRTPRNLDIAEPWILSVLEDRAMMHVPSKLGTCFQVSKPSAKGPLSKRKRI